MRSLKTKSSILAIAAITFVFIFSSCDLSSTRSLLSSEPAPTGLPTVEGVNNFPIITITGLRASILQGGGGIDLSWNMDGRTAGSYAIYRSAFQNFKNATGNWDLSKMIDGRVVNNYHDGSAADKIPYFYFVTYTSGNQESVMDAAPVLGIGNSDAALTDMYEPNDTAATSKALPIGTPVNAMFFAISDGNGQHNLDNDWYSVTIPKADAISNQSYSIHISVLDTTIPLGNLRFQFHYNNSDSSEYNFSAFNQDFLYSSFSSPTVNVTNDVQLYFRIGLADFTYTGNNFARYTITVNTGL